MSLYTLHTLATGGQTVRDRQLRAAGGQQRHAQECRVRHTGGWGGRAAHPVGIAPGVDPDRPSSVPMGMSDRRPRAPPASDAGADRQLPLAIADAACRPGGVLQPAFEVGPWPVATSRRIRVYRSLRWHEISIV